jgi:hypothetical protein
MLLCSRGAFSPISQSSAGGHKRSSPQRKGPHGGSQVQDSLLEYSEFTAGDNTSVGSGLGMDDIPGTAHGLHFLATCVVVCLQCCYYVYAHRAVLSFWGSYCTVHQCLT